MLEIIFIYLFFIFLFVLLGTVIQKSGKRINKYTAYKNKLLADEDMVQKLISINNLDLMSNTIKFLSKDYRFNVNQIKSISNKYLSMVNVEQGKRLSVNTFVRSAIVNEFLELIEYKYASFYEAEIIAADISEKRLNRVLLE